MKHFFTALIFFGLYFSVVFQAHLQAQELRGKVYRKETKQALPEITVCLLNTAFCTRTDSAGNFTFRNIPQGSYTLQVSAIGFRAVHQKAASNQSDIEIVLTESVTELNQVIITTAQRNQTITFESPYQISTLSAAQIAQAAPRTTPEALMSVNGIWVQKTNHGGGSPFIRGLTGNQTLMLFDGIRLNNSTYRFGPNQYLNTIDPLTLAGVEVVKGSGSVQYGSDALGGVVNVLTKTPSFAQDKFQLGGALYGKYWSADMEKTSRLEFNAASRQTAFLGGFSWNDFGDIRGGDNIGKQTPTGYRQWAVDGKIQQKIGQNQILTLAGQYLAQQNVPVFHRIQLENFKTAEFTLQSRFAAYLRWEYFSENLLWQKISTTFFTGNTLESRKLQKNNSTQITHEKDEISTLAAIIEVQSELSKKWQAVSGVEVYHDRVQSTKNIFDESTNTISEKRGLYPDNAKALNWAVFSLHQLDFDKLKVAAGLRLNGFGLTLKDADVGAVKLTPTAWVGNVALQYFLHPQHQIIASVSRAFRAPNIDDLGTLGIVDFRYEVPNYDLEAEKSLNFEMGYKTVSDKFSAQVSVFRNQLKDLIDRQQGFYNGNDSLNGYPIYLKKNVSKAYIQGIEVEAEYQVFPQMVAYGSLAFAYGQNETRNEPMRRIPPFNARLGLKYQTKFGLKVHLETWLAAWQHRLAQGDIADNRIADEGTPAWEVLNFYVNYSRKHWQINAGIQNILDKAYRTHGSGIDGYGRSVWMSGKIIF
jgi:iron complex outermembrane receptor protein/hemoglobin/transferrin/lactoferrin receptor protein